MICIHYFMISHHLHQSIADKKFSPMRQEFTCSFTVLWLYQRYFLRRLCEALSGFANRRIRSCIEWLNHWLYRRNLSRRFCEVLSGLAKLLSPKGFAKLKSHSGIPRRAPNSIVQQSTTCFSGLRPLQRKTWLRKIDVTSCVD